MKLQKRASLVEIHKRREFDRSAYLFKQILEEQGIYFALMFLLDSGYGRIEIEQIAERFKDKK